MSNFRQQFIEFAIKNNVIRFGEFKLKSGRISPYFFNAGLFNTGSQLVQLSQFYAQTLAASELEYDVLFGPAYKGIPLATATAMSLSTHFGRDTPLCFNRKEPKDHGEGGNLVGAPLKGNVVIVDDVITAGTAIREALDIISNAGAKPVAVVIALDRQEKGTGELSAIQEVEQQFNIPVISIIKLSDIADYLQQKDDADILEKIEQYRTNYGVTD